MKECIYRGKNKKQLLNSLRQTLKQISPTFKEEEGRKKRESSCKSLIVNASSDVNED